jgi:2-polyprenyl-3-methyl-5-hydroxy-6-metoxy-1,4-benzoquinol methylase
MTTATQEIDMARTMEFGGKIVGHINGAVISLMLTAGHQTGLFDRMAEMPPSTSEEIAKATGLNERYVREWLGSMVTAGIIEYDPMKKTYHLPPEHAASLTRAAGPGNLCTFSEFIPEMASVLDQVVESFRKGGGVPYSEFKNFQRLMAAESAQVVDATLINVTLPLVPGLVEKLQSGIDVADLACGQGHAINVMAQEFPKSRFTGYDFSEEGVAAGRNEAQSVGLKNAAFEQQDVSNMSGKGQFDLVTAFDAIHDQAKPRKVLKNIHNLLRPGGTFLCVDIAASSNLEENMEHPMGPALYGISTLHCMTVSLALGGEGLGTMWGEQKARELFDEAGFKDIDVKQVDGDILNNYYIARKG